MANVTLKDITKKYGENTVVSNISLEVADGTLVSVLGPSGCGKTTTLRMIAGFESPDGGEILFDGVPITQVGVNKRNIGMVFQSYALFPHMTVWQNIAYGLEQRKFSKTEIEEKVMAILKMVHMEEYKNRKPKQLSGGQQQRVALARALVINPRVLLLDECLSALDKKLRMEMQFELRKILEESKVTTFFVTHDQEEAMTLSDIIVVMNNGKIEQVGTPFEVYEKPKNKFVAEFLGKTNFIEGRVTEIGDGFVCIENNDVCEKISAHTSANIGEWVLFSVRPERISFSNGGISGKIINSVYSGNLTTYTVELVGRTIVAEIQNSAKNANLSVGSKVNVSWAAEACVPLEKEVL